MKPSKILGVIIFLILIASGCIDSGDNPSEVTPAKETPIAEQSAPTTANQNEKTPQTRT
ncbi:MAG: hypothetical protein NHB15_03100 [Methanosarcina barkeri]|nr:hypothetical protein [Methanosarcina sp. ERenArc_MAG2]